MCTLKFVLCVLAVLAAAMKFAQARLSPPSYGQIGAEGALDTPKEYFEGVKTEYISRRDFVIEELNKIEGNIPLTRPTLTMGWCIECHDQAVSKGYNDDKNGYYVELKKRLRKNKTLFKQHLEDDKVTVEELGGWECAKCHY